MRRIRFSLRAVLIVATALILFLGYWSWRREYIRGEVEKLERLGVRFSAEQDFFGTPEFVVLPDVDRSKRGEIIRRLEAIGVTRAIPE